MHQRDVNSVLSSALEHVGRTFHSSRFSIALVDEDRDGLTMLQVFSSINQKTRIPNGTFLPRGMAALSEAVHHKKAIFREDIRVTTPKYELDKILIERGVLCDYIVPLIVEDRCLGTLNCGVSEVGNISSAFRLMMDLLAPRLALAIYNAQLFETISGNEARVQALLENSEDQILITDINGHATWLSSSVSRSRGRTTESLQAAGPFDHIHEEDVERLQALKYRIQASQGIPLPMDYRVQHGDGSWHYYEGTATNLLEDPRIKGIVIDVRDVTERRALEQEAQRSEKLESIGLLAGGLAHDFNNLLTSLFGSLDLIKVATLRGNSPDKPLANAREAANRAADLTRQLLTFAQGGAPQKKICSIETIAREAAGLVFHGSNVRCLFDVKEECWPALVDAAQISQVFHNLLINANQAMPEGGTVRMTIENIVQKEEQHRVRVAVTDQGHGIDLHTISKIFDPYFTTKPHGSGLGIPIAYTIVKRHGGVLDVQSTSQDGTTFAFDLPASPTGKIPAKPKIQPLQKGHGRILVMDDDKMIRENATALLKELGYEAITVEDGEEAVKLYTEAISSRTPFTAIIMDLTVPGAMGGKEAMKKIKTIDPDCTAIVSSGYSGDKVMSHFQDYGFKGALPKPHTLEQMSNTLHKLLGDRNSSRSSAPQK